MCLCVSALRQPVVGSVLRGLPVCGERAADAVRLPGVLLRQLLPAATGAHQWPLRQDDSASLAGEPRHPPVAGVASRPEARHSPGGCCGHCLRLLLVSDPSESIQDNVERKEKQQTENLYN